MYSSSLYISGETIVPYQCTPSAEAEITATVIRKVFAGLSVFGSSFIIATLLEKWRRNPKTIDPYCRIMLGLSVYDIIWSFFPWFMGSWLMPAATGHWGAVGNTHTCTMQGFFFWLGVPGAQYYQILLSLHTLLLVTFGWRPHEFQKRIECWSHAVIFLFAMVLATVPLFFEGYNPECATCLPAPLPIWCGDWVFWGDGETDCLRGSARLSQAYYTIYLTNLSIMGTFCTWAMIQVYCSIRRQEVRQSRWVHRSIQTTEQNQTQPRRIRRTMILYTFGFYLCWIVPSFIIHFAQQGTPWIIMSYILLPFQGFFNMIIFLAPKCSKYQRFHPGTWLVVAYLHVVFGSCFQAILHCWERIFRRDPSDDIQQQRLSRIRNPFRLSANTAQASDVLTASQIRSIYELDGDHDDGIGFRDFNQDRSEISQPDSRATQEPNNTRPDERNDNTDDQKGLEDETDIGVSSELNDSRQNGGERKISPCDNEPS